MVSCAECGYLAVRDKDTRELEEVERSETGGVGFLFLQATVDGEISDYRRKHEYPICFMRKRNLGDEYGELAKLDTPEIDKRIISIVFKDRECDEFTQWQQGFTPKEHRDMMDRQWKLEYEARRDAEDKKWREDQDIKAEQRHNDQMDQMQSIHKNEMWIIGFIVTIAVIIVTILASAIEANWIPKWFGLCF